LARRPEKGACILRPPAPPPASGPRGQVQAAAPDCGAGWGPAQVGAAFRRRLPPRRSLRNGDVGV